MSIQAVAWVLDHSIATLADRLVLIAIASHADAKGWNAWPAIDRIAHEARVHRATVMRSIQSLEALGELTVNRRPGRPSQYGITALLEGSQDATGRGSQDATGRGVAICDGGVANDARTRRKLRPEPLRAFKEPSKSLARTRVREDPLALRALSAVPRSSYSAALALIDQLRAEGIGDVVIDEAIGYALTRDDVRSLGFLQQIARDWMHQRDGMWSG